MAARAVERSTSIVDALFGRFGGGGGGGADASSAHPPHPTPLPATAAAAGAAAAPDGLGDAVWQDREIRFDAPPRDLACRRGEEVLDFLVRRPGGRGAWRWLCRLVVA